MSEHDEYIPSEPTKVVAKDKSASLVTKEVSNTLIEMTEKIVSETNTLLSLNGEAESNLLSLEGSLSEMLVDSAERMVSETVVQALKDSSVYTQLSLDESVIPSVIENVVAAVSTIMSDPDHITPTAIIESVDVKTLTAILQNVLAKTDGLDKYSIQLTPEIKHIFNLLVADSKYFDDVEKSLKLIVQDDKIDAKDVPQIMVLLTNLYSKLRGLRIEFNEKICGDMLKFVFDVAIKDGLIKMNKADMELLTCVYSIIDMSIQLIQTDKFPTKVVGILSCIYKSFFARK